MLLEKPEIPLDPIIKGVLYKYLDDSYIDRLRKEILNRKFQIESIKSKLSSSKIEIFATTKSGEVVYFMNGTRLRILNPDEINSDVICAHPMQENLIVSRKNKIIFYDYLNKIETVTIDKSSSLESLGEIRQISALNNSTIILFPVNKGIFIVDVRQKKLIYENEEFSYAKADYWQVLQSNVFACISDRAFHIFWYQDQSNTIDYQGKFMLSSNSYMIYLIGLSDNRIVYNDGDFLRENRILYKERQLENLSKVELKCSHDTSCTTFLNKLTDDLIVVGFTHVDVYRLSSGQHVYRFDSKLDINQFEQFLIGGDVYARNTIITLNFKSDFTIYTNVDEINFDMHERYEIQGGNKIFNYFVVKK